MGKQLVLITDSTLGDAQQPLAARFGVSDQVRVALALQAAGIDAVEVRVAARDVDAVAAAGAVRSVLDKTATIAWCHNERDLDAAVRAGIARACISVPLSDRQIRAGFNGGRAGILERLCRLVAHGRRAGLAMAVSGEDASRADRDFILQASSASQWAGASRFRFVDTFGVMEPLDVYSTFRQLRGAAALELEFRGGNDLGLAAANTIAAVHAGATGVSTRLIDGAGGAAEEPLSDVVTALIGLGRDVNVLLARVPSLVESIAETAARNARRPRVQRRIASSRAARCP